MLKLFISLIILVASFSVKADPVYIVKIINFSCAYCRASESIDPPIIQAVEGTGGKFVYAPLTWGEGQSSTKDLAYYWLKTKYAKSEDNIRDSFYKGSQDFGYLFEDPSQILVFLKQEYAGAFDSLTVEEISNALNSDIAQGRRHKALKLGVEAGVNAVPAYIFVKNGKAVGLLDRESSSNNFSALRDAVLKKIDELSKSSSN